MVVVCAVREHVADGADHLVEDGDGGLGHDDLAEAEVDALPFHAVGDGAAGLGLL